MSPLGRHLTIGGLAALLQNYRPADPEAGHPKKIRPVAPTRPNGFVNHVAMVAKKILILRAEARMDSFFNLLSGFIFPDSGAGIQVPIKAAPSIPSTHRSPKHSRHA